MTETLKPSLSVKWIQSLAEISQSEWDALAMPLKTPFFEWSWLRTMETSGSVGGNSGWHPCHLTLWRDRHLIAAAPLYLKDHSYGEFVFDQQWAELAHHLGIRYYPKLLGMSPVTPAEGYRFLIAPGEDEAAITERLVVEIDLFCDRQRISSCHFLYVDPVWRATLEQLGFTAWMHHSYIWQNQGYQTFEDYLAAFNANQRRNIKRERQAMSTAGLELRVLTGDEISRSLLTLMYHFYSDTCDKFGWWGSKYLTRNFFEQLHTTFRHRLILIAAYQDQDLTHPQAMSFCLTKADRLYGRYWGAYQDVDCLHFNACYYHPIEWAIAQGIQTFDPGAGGRHKPRRGFPATPNYSLHRFYNARLLHILQPHILEVNELERQNIAAINETLPFRRS